MILDELLEFADATSVAAAAGTALIGDVINLQEARDIGNGEPIYLVIQCATSIITGGSAGTIKFQLASDAQAAIATDGSATVHFDTGTFVTDGDDANALDAGATIAAFALPMAGNAYEQYLGILCTVGTTTVTAGAINAFITKDVSKWKAYPDGQN
jgi:subtilisin family serine protease